MKECIELEFSDDYRCGYNDALLEFRAQTCKNCAWFHDGDCTRDGMLIVPMIIDNLGCGKWEARNDK
jgi:hypothetical protein